MAGNIIKAEYCDTRLKNIKSMYFISEWESSKCINGNIVSYDGDCSPLRGFIGDLVEWNPKSRVLLFHPFKHDEFLNEYYKTSRSSRGDYYEKYRAFLISSNVLKFIKHSDIIDF